MQRRTLFGLISAVTAALSLRAFPALAACDAAADTAFLTGMLRSHALPRFEAMAAASASYAGRLERFAAGLEASRDAHRAVTDAWAGVQHLRPGPLTMELRSDRIAFWPERPGVVQRQIAQALRDRDSKLLQPGALARQSSALQGLTVLERLLFDEDITVGAFSGDEAGQYRGALAVAAARNLAAIAAEARDGWAALDAPLAAGDATILGQTPAEAVNTLFTAALTALSVVTDQKLEAPLGDGPADARPAVVEALRSGRALRNIALNLDALRALMLASATVRASPCCCPPTPGATWPGGWSATASPSPSGRWRRSPAPWTAR